MIQRRHDIPLDAGASEHNVWTIRMSASRLIVFHEDVVCGSQSHLHHQNDLIIEKKKKNMNQKQPGVRLSSNTK